MEPNETAAGAAAAGAAGAAAEGTEEAWEAGEVCCLEGTLARVLRQGEDAWITPRCAAKCRSQLQAAQLRLALSFLQHGRLTERCPAELEAGRLPETIAACFAAVDPTTHLFWEEEGSAAGAPVAIVDLIRGQVHSEPSFWDLGRGRAEAGFWDLGFGSTNAKLRAPGGAVLGLALAALPHAFDRYPSHALNLHSNSLTDVGMHPITVAIADRMPHLTELRVGGNFLGDQAMCALARALGGCSGLEDLDIQDNNIRGAGFEALAAQVHRWPKLRWLATYHNPGPADALGRALAAALPSMRHAKGFSLSMLSDEVKQLLDAANLDAKGSGVRLSLG